MRGGYLESQCYFANCISQGYLLHFYYHQLFLKFIDFIKFIDFRFQFPDLKALISESLMLLTLSLTTVVMFDCKFCLELLRLS